MASKFKRNTKRLYDTIKCDDDSSGNEALPALIIDNFDDEQIWQELELQNDPLVNRLIADVSKVSVCKDFTFGVQPKKTKDVLMETYSETSNESEEIVESSDDQIESDDDLDDLDIDLPLGKNDQGLFDNEDIQSDEELELEKILDKATKVGEEDEESDQHSESKGMEEDTEQNEEKPRKENKSDKIKKPISTNKRNKAPKRRTVVDDAFFRMADMEEFLDREDAREERKHRKKTERDTSSEEEDEEEIDYFADDPSSADDDDDEAGVVISLYFQK